MELYIGGYAQGKLKCALSDHAAENTVVYNAKLPTDDLESGKTVVLYNLNDLIKQMLTEGKNPQDEIMDFAEDYPNCVIISDEIGNGIVPVAQKERDYRDCVGRIQVELARKAESVKRVICGIGVKIK